jgi:hypothetical protein
MKILIAVVLSLMAVAATKAQQVGPLYVEAKNKIKSQVAIGNLGVTNLIVTLEAREAVKGADGKMQFVSPTSGVKFELQDTSAIIPPKATRTVDYKASCEHDCLLVVMVGMITGHSKEGIQTRLIIPSSVYLCQNSAKDCRPRIKRSLGME